MAELAIINGYDIRDRKLADATIKTGASEFVSDYVMLQSATDNSYSKISKSAFTEAIRNVLGGLLATNDKGTTVSAIPCVSGSGSSQDFGSISTSNLASVLGDSNFRWNNMSIITRYFDTRSETP